jgi:hypothetical protein
MNERNLGCNGRDRENFKDSGRIEKNDDSSLRHMRPREICYCLLLGSLNVPTDSLLLEVWKVPHRLSPRNETKLLLPKM